MPYITNYNANSILSRLDIDNLHLSGDIYKKRIYIFSSYEEKELLLIKAFISDPNKFFKDFYVAVKPHEDTYTFVNEYEGMRPAYHKVINCNRLNADYKGIYIPEEIRKKGKLAVLEFREWFKTVEHIYERDKTLYVERLWMKYKIRTNPANLEKDNTGSEYFSNAKIEEIEHKIDELLRAAGRYYYQSPKNTEILKVFGKMTFLAYRSDSIYRNRTKYSDQDIKDFLLNYDRNFKKPLMKMLRDYYRVKYNPNLDFSMLLLERLGFKACSACYEKNPTADISISDSSGNLDQDLTNYFRDKDHHKDQPDLGEDFPYFIDDSSDDDLPF